MKTKGKWKIAFLNKRRLNMTCTSLKDIVHCQEKESDSSTSKAKIYTLFWFRARVKKKKKDIGI